MFPAIFIQCEWQVYHIYKHWNIYLISSWGSFTFFKQWKRIFCTGVCKSRKQIPSAQVELRKFHSIFRNVCSNNSVVSYQALCLHPPRGCRYNHTLIFNGMDVCRKQLPESRWWQSNHIAKCSLQNLLEQFSARAPEATAALPTTRKHRTVASKHKRSVPSLCSFRAWPACPWRSDTDCH